MTASVTRLGDALRVGPRLAGAMLVALLLALALATALATRSAVLPLAIAGVVGVVATIVGFRWPLVLLLVFAALIPIEEVVVISGLGTLSRAAGILFAVTYALPRLSRLQFTAIPVAGWAYLGWAFASLAWSISPDAASAQLATLAQLFLIALFTADFVVHQPSIVRPILWAYSLSAAVTAVIGIGSYVARGLGTERSVAISNQDPAQFAALLLPAFVFGLYELMHGERRVLGGIIATLTAIGVLVSGTRGAWLACAVVVLFVVLPQLSARRRLVAIVAIAAMSAIAYQVPGVADLIAERSGNALSSGGAGRTDIWTVAISDLRIRPAGGRWLRQLPGRVHHADHSRVRRRLAAGCRNPGGDLTTSSWPMRSSSGSWGSGCWPCSSARCSSGAGGAARHEPCRRP